MADQAESTANDKPDTAEEEPIVTEHALDRGQCDEQHR